MRDGVSYQQQVINQPGEGGNMTVRVQYHNDVYDIISEFTLQRLLTNGKVKKFYRYSERKWITIGSDPIRDYDRERDRYVGSERRTPQIFSVSS
jgi:hypothetical protein